MESRYYIPLVIMQRTKKFLVQQGKADKEAYVLWKGQRRSNSDYTVTGIIIPDQIAIRSSFGYSFEIPQKSVGEVIAALRQTNEIGLIQVHSHPGHSARHSDRDDKLSLLGRKGALSIVVPNFGNVVFDDFSNTMVHILTGIHKWDVLRLEHIKKTLIVER